MILKSIRLTDGDWILNKVELKKSNLIVGKNSAGKSKFLKALQKLFAVLSQSRQEGELFKFFAEIVLEDENDSIRYIIQYASDLVVHESLILNDKQIIDRFSNKASINGETVNPPEDKLLLHVRRDIQKNPEFEKIIKWAEDSVIDSFTNKNAVSEKVAHDVLSKLSSQMKVHLVDMIRSIGFPVINVDTLDNHFNNKRAEKKSIEEKSSRFPYILVEEENVGLLLSDSISSGMFRTIILLILLEQFISLKRPALIAIDDVGEGLDYARATKVGKLLFEVCEKNNIQIIATSNEEFMMNIVDITQWNILVRKGKEVKSISSELCPDEFKSFKYSGLSNYDFFTSDFLNRISTNLFN